MVRLVPAIVHCLLAIVNHSKAGGGSGLLIGLANVSLIHKLDPVASTMRYKVMKSGQYREGTGR